MIAIIGPLLTLIATEGGQENDRFPDGADLAADRACAGQQLGRLSG